MIFIKTFTRKLQHALLAWMLRQDQPQHDVHWGLVVLAWIGCVGMPAYYLLWTYWFPQQFESVSVRLIGAALCMLVLYRPTWLSGRALAAYLFLTATYVLPFQFTYMYLMNSGSALWSQSLLIALIVLLHFPTRWALTSYLSGTALACLLFGFTGAPGFMLSAVVLEQLPIYAFTIVVVSAAKVGRRVPAHEKMAGMAHALATVSHELRTPLISVDANVRGINRRLANPGQLDEADWHAMGDAIARIQYEVRHMNHMIDLFLMSAVAVSQPLKADQTVSMREVVESVIRRYPFAAQSQRDAVRVDIRGDFLFAGRHELAVVVLFNLRRNARKALARAGKGRIRIVEDGRRAMPRLLFIDTGCGIAAGQLPLIFKRFYSFPPSSGSGIGLALSKEIIDAWQATIRCVSRELAYTIFVLEFPRVSTPAP